MEVQSSHGLGSPAAAVETLVDVASHLLDYEEAIDADSRMAAFETIRTRLDPRLFSYRTEPRKGIVKWLRAVNADDSQRLSASISAVLDLPEDRVSSPALAMLLSLLADVDVQLKEALAFTALQALLLNPPPGEYADEAFGAVIRIAGRDVRTVTSLLERWRASHPIVSSAIFAALQSVARFEPARLGVIFRLLSRDIVAANIPPTTMQFLVRDLIARAGSFTVLQALSLVDPEECPPLFKGAFGLENSPYDLIRRIWGPNSGDQALLIFDHDRRYMPDELHPECDQIWLSLVRRVSKAQPQLWFDEDEDCTQLEIECIGLRVADDQPGTHAAVPISRSLPLNLPASVPEAVRAFFAPTRPLRV